MALKLSTIFFLLATEKHFQSINMWPRLWNACTYSSHKCVLACMCRHTWWICSSRITSCTSAGSSFVVVRACLTKRPERYTYHVYHKGMHFSELGMNSYFILVHFIKSYVGKGNMKFTSCALPRVILCLKTCSQSQSCFLLFRCAAI